MNARRRFCLTGTALALGPKLATAAIDWTTGNPEPAGLRPGLLANALQAGEALPALRALLVARGGVLVAERYYAGAQVEDLQPINSATKSVCSLLVGLALHSGQLRSLDQTVAQLIPEAVADVPGSPAAALTLRQIMSGRSGMAFDPMRYRELVSAKPFLRYALSRPSLPVAAQAGPTTTPWWRCWRPSCNGPRAPTWPRWRRGSCSSPWALIRLAGSATVTANRWPPPAWPCARVTC